MENPLRSDCQFLPATAAFLTSPAFFLSRQQPFRHPKSMQRPGRFLSSALSATSRRTPKLKLPKPLPYQHPASFSGDLAVQGPHCRFVDKDILRHCVYCVKEQKRSTFYPDDVVKELIQKARASLKKSERGQAERLFLRAIVANPTRSQSYFLYALHVQKRDPQLARDLFFHGIRENPNDAKILQAWGLFESKQGYLRRAQSLLIRSVSLDPKNAPVLRWKCLFPQRVKSP